MMSGVLEFHLKQIECFFLGNPVEARLHCRFLRDLRKWLILCYIGEKSFGQWRSYRLVFYSNTGAPLAFDILKACAKDISSLIIAAGDSNEEIKHSCRDEYVARRYQNLVDLVEI